MNITKSYSDVRQFGPNRGIPMLHLEIDDILKKPQDELLKQVLDSTRSVGWIYIKGDNVPGLGSFLKALITEFRINIELQLDTDRPAPGWINSPNNVLIPYHPNSSFNYLTLRQEKDFILFKAKTPEDLEALVPVYENWKLTPATKWLLVSEDIYWSAYDLVIKYPRCRMSIKEVNSYVKVNTKTLQVSS